MKSFFQQRPLYTIALFLSITCLLATCGGAPGNTARSTNQANAQTSNSITTHSGEITPIPGLSPGPQSCPSAVKDPTYWNALLSTQPEVSAVESVTCGYLRGVPQLQALVTVRYTGTNALLDIYIYDNLIGAAPTLLFKLPHLLKGSAKISHYNTLLTAEVDEISSVNAQPGTTLTQDLFREFQWDNQLGTLVQIAFPGIFPDLTRYQAEADQAQVNQGSQLWKLNALQTARTLGTSLLHWDQNASATIVSGAGTHDLHAMVKLRSSSPRGAGVMITMTRLENNTNGGIWIVTAVTSSNLSITQPQSAAIIHSTTIITGTGSASENVIGAVTILDHGYTTIGHATVHGASGNGNTTFSTSVNVQPTFKTGVEEGLVLLTVEESTGSGITSAAIVKVLIQQ